MESMAKHSLLDRETISFSYNIFTNTDKADMAKIKSDWEKELTSQIDEDTWEECLNNINRCFINVRHILVRFKIIHRLHNTKVKVHKL